MYNEVFVVFGDDCETELYKKYNARIFWQTSKYEFNNRQLRSHNGWKYHKTWTKYLRHVSMKSIYQDYNNLNLRIANLH